MMTSAESLKIEPSPQRLGGKKAAILVGDHFHVHEAYYPYFRLKEAGVEVVFVGQNARAQYHDYHGEPLRSHISIKEALKQAFDLIHIPGGFAPMRLRANDDMVQFAKAHYRSGRLLSSICHAGSFLVTLDIVKGRKATCYHTVKDDLINAGAEYIEDAPVLDGHLITARTPDDLPQFMEAIIRYMEKGPDAALQPSQTLPLTGKRIGILVDTRYQVHQVWYSYYRFLAEGAKVEFIGDKRHEVYFSRVSRVELKSHRSVREAMHIEYDALILSGDWAADKMRVNSSFLNFVKKHDSAKKPIVSIAEGHSLLISAGLLKEREVAGLPEMSQDLKNSGAVVIQGPAWCHGHLITGRSTVELPDVMRWILSYFKTY
jgi:protease I